MILANEKNEKILKLLLEHREINVNLQDIDGETALMILFMNSFDKVDLSLNMIEKLNFPGINLNLVDKKKNKYIILLLRIVKNCS